MGAETRPLRQEQVVFSDETTLHNVETKFMLMLVKKKNVSQAVFLWLVRREWEGISDTMAFTCITSMSERVDALIAAKGEHTRF